MPLLQIKICGLTNRDDVLYALDSGADYIGFVTYPRSPRAIAGLDVSRLLDGIDRPYKAVGVFVNESRDEVERIASDCGLHAVQIHGDEAAEEFGGMSVPVWRAVSYRDGHWTPVPDTWPADRYLVDAHAPDRYGGTGEEADWIAAAELAREKPVMLAGGLTPDSVAEAVRTVRPMGVDVITGTESTPGKKDPDKLRAFIANARSAAADSG